jgi:hypothetical protein
MVEMQMKQIDRMVVAMKTAVTLNKNARSFLVSQKEDCDHDDM